MNVCVRRNRLQKPRRIDNISRSRGGRVSFLTVYSVIHRGAGSRDKLAGMGGSGCTEEQCSHRFST
jgi:hypothetical protein